MVVGHLKNFCSMFLYKKYSQTDYEKWNESCWINHHTFQKKNKMMYMQKMFGLKKGMKLCIQKDSLFI